MALPTRAQPPADQPIDRYCRERVPAHTQGQIRGKAPSDPLFGVRPYWHAAKRETRSKAAPFRCDRLSDTWSLYWRNGTGRWHLDELLTPTAGLTEVLAEIDLDPVALFMGMSAWRGGRMR